MNKDAKISMYLFLILKRKNISISEFSKMLQKPKPEIIRMVTGINYKFNLKLIAKIESVLGEEIIQIEK